MIELKQGCRVPFPEKLFEQYEVNKTYITANVNASKVMDMMKRFIENHKNEYLFFILEIPTNLNDEPKTENGNVADLSEDVYFIDGLDYENALGALNSLGNFLIKDGLNTFGFGGHESKEEILFGRYNVMTIYTRTPENYEKFFEEFSIEKTDNLVTAWKTFDSEHFGECFRHIGIEGNTIFDIPEAFKENGMYFYERRGGKPLGFEELVGKVLLAGLSYYSEDNELLDRVQLWGTVIEANEKNIAIKKSNGEIFHLPPDLSSTTRAKKGEYTLHSTGEVVTDPDFLSTWNITRPDKTE